MVQKGYHEPGEKPRRFYKAVEVRAGEGGFEVLLDGRSPRSAKGARLTAPTRALAEMLAEEWAGQGEFIDMQSMAATRLAFIRQRILSGRDVPAHQLDEQRQLAEIVALRDAVLR